MAASNVYIFGSIALTVLLWVIALVTLWRASRKRKRGTGFLVTWVIVIIILPWLGSLAWLLVGYPMTTRRDRYTPNRQGG
jgi:predicted alpha/beta hydrolase